MKPDLQKTVILCVYVGGDHLILRTSERQELLQGDSVAAEALLLGGLQNGGIFTSFEL